MNPGDDREESLFRGALERPAGSERKVFLDEVCVGNEVLRARLEAMIQAAERREADVKPSYPQANNPTVRLSFPEDEAIGTRIGCYKVLRKIGEGGCGAVYMAEQEEP